MFKILVLNGSPRRENSSTMVVTRAFVKGLTEEGDSTVEYINISDLKITPCLGCLSCWAKTEGKCVIKNDDILSIKEKIDDADIIIASYPLYFFGMPGIMKLFTDRMMPMMNTYRGQKPPVNGESFHGFRNPNEKAKFVLISSCAYVDASKVYESLLLQYDFICGKKNYTPILCPEVKTLVDLKNENKINKYLEKFTDAGKEFVKFNSLSEDTILNLRKPPFGEGAYKIFLDAFWNQEKGLSNNNK